MTLSADLIRRARERHRKRSRGQSIVEFALLLPAFLLLVLVALDFGRVYLGWVNLQNMTRVAANFAANNAEAWGVPGDATVKARYQELIANDARAINCQPPDPIPDPIFSTGTDMGDPVTVNIDCNFTVLTPIISNVLGPNILVSASVEFPVKAGLVGSVPGGAPPVPAPIASFTASPTSGNEDLEVTVVDTSKNNPASWRWTWGDGTAASFAKSPPPHVYQDPGTYTLTLVVQNAGGSSTATATIEVLPAPPTGPIPDFAATPRSGQVPPNLAVHFTDLSTNGATSWSWTFGDGGTSTQQNPSHNYTASGSYDVTLTVSDGTTSNSQTKVGFIVVADKPCIVPNFAGVRKNSAQGIWATAGFTTNMTFLPGQGNYKIGVQSLPGGLTNPPNGCNATIQVGP
jgi:PKD repeat protein